MHIWGPFGTARLLVALAGERAKQPYKKRLLTRSLKELELFFFPRSQNYKNMASSSSSLQTWYKLLQHCLWSHFTKRFWKWLYHRQRSCFTIRVWARSMPNWPGCKRPWPTDTNPIESNQINLHYFLLSFFFLCCSFQILLTVNILIDTTTRGGILGLLADLEQPSDV